MSLFTSPRHYNLSHLESMATILLSKQLRCTVMAYKHESLPTKELAPDKKNDACHNVIMALVWM